MTSHNEATWTTTTEAIAEWIQSARTRPSNKARIPLATSRIFMSGHTLLLPRGSFCIRPMILILPTALLISALKPITIFLSDFFRNRCWRPTPICIPSVPRGSSLPHRYFRIRDNLNRAKRCEKNLLKGQACYPLDVTACNICSARFNYTRTQQPEVNSLPEIRCSSSRFIYKSPQ